MKSAAVALALVAAFALTACASESDESIAASYDAIEAYASAPKVAARVTQTNLEGGAWEAAVAPDLIDPWGNAVGTGGASSALAKKGGTYTGITHLGSRLFAADFANGRIDLFDEGSRPVALAGAFVDPALPASYAPFNVQALGGKIYVAYGTTDALGGGIVDAFDADGRFLDRVAQGGSLDAPWGLALAPATFGRLGGALLVGNFGSGQIVAFDPDTGAELGPLADGNGQPIALEQLWALSFPPGSNELHFTAGVGGEAHGRCGRFDLVP